MQRVLGDYQLLELKRVDEGVMAQVMDMNLVHGDLELIVGVGALCFYGVHLLNDELRGFCRVSPKIPGTVGGNPGDDG